MYVGKYIFFGGRKRGSENVSLVIFCSHLHRILMSVWTVLPTLIQHENAFLVRERKAEQQDPKIHFMQLVCRDVRRFKFSKADACILARKSRLTRKSPCLSPGRCLESLMFHGSTVQQLTTVHNPVLYPPFTGHLKGNKVKPELRWYKSLHGYKPFEKTHFKQQRKHIFIVEY